MKKIFVASLRQETNSFSPVKTTLRDFDIHKGESMLNTISCTSFFRKAGFEIIPSISAYSLPSGTVEKKSFTYLKNQIIDSMPDDGSVDGIWLYLHGAMNVEKVGSGEAVLVSEIRKKAGESIPIAVALDFHANNTKALTDSANIIYGYRTAPHVDQHETQLRTAELLTECIDNNILPKPVMVRPPLLFPGEMVTTGIEPAKSLIKELDVIESHPDILCASVFSGMPWVDAPNSGASIVVTGIGSNEKASSEAKRLAEMFWDCRNKFRFEEEAAKPESAIKKAVLSKEYPVFISDSGDNVTAGAFGDSTYLLNLLIKEEAEDTLVAGITDSRTVEMCRKMERGSNINITLGSKLNKHSKPVKIKARLKRKNMGSVVISTEGIDVIVTAKREAFTSPSKIKDFGVDPFDYKIIVVKLGYLFDDLRKISKRSIMALTPGSSSLDLSNIKYRKLKRPVYPLDKDFTWQPEN